MPFKKGKSGNPGGRPKEHGRNLKLFLKLLSKERFEKIANKTIELAERGDARARQDVFDYGLGKPLQPVDVDMDGKVTITVKYAESGNNPAETP